VAGWGSERWGRRRALDSTVLNDAVATQGHDHGETAADGRGRLGDDLDGAAHSGRASVLDAHRCADGIPSAPRLTHLRELAHRKKMLTLLTATKDIDISEAAVLAKLVLS
jgi:hypothetical protein